MPREVMQKFFLYLLSQPRKEKIGKIKQAQKRSIWSLKSYIYVSGPKGGVLEFLLHTNSTLKLLL